jgi:eukaryotic-like serine/threonine-protein kinase
VAMDLLEGVTLEHRIAQWGPQRFEDTLHVMLQALSGLRAAHAAGIVHRDLKPENIFLVRRSDGSDFVKLLDFGIGKRSDAGAPGMTSTGAVFGTPSYMAPEQMRDSKEVDRRADIFAMGVILYRMLTGKLPFLGASPTEVALAMHRGELVPPEHLRPDIPPPWRELVSRCLALRPEDRPQTIKELADTLIAGHPAGPEIARRVAADLLVTASPDEETTRHEEPAPPATTSYHTAGAVAAPPVAPARRSRWYVLGLAGAILAGGAGAALLAARAGSGAGERQEASAAAPSAIEPADAALPTADAPPTTVTLEIVTRPPGARIRVDDVDLGVAPTPWSGRVGDRVVIEASRDGHVTTTKEVVVHAEMPPVEVELAPAGPVDTPIRKTRPTRGRPPPDSTAPAFDPNGVVR